MAIKDDRIFDKFARFEGDKYWTSYDPLSEKPPVKKPAGPPKVIDTLTMDYKEGGGDAAALRRGSAARTAATTGGTSTGGSSTAGGGVIKTSDIDDKPRAICMSTGGSWDDSTEACTCPEGTYWAGAGSGCVTIPTCEEGFVWSAEAGECIRKTDDTVDTPESCAAKGEGWKWDEATGTCKKVDDSGLTGEKVPYEKPKRYDWEDTSAVDPRPGTPRAASETRELEKRRTESKPVAESARDHLVGETVGVGAKHEALARDELDREFRRAQTKATQDFARAGMSFSAPQMDFEEDLIREAAMQRIITADQADNMQLQLRANALKNASALEIMADSGRLASDAMSGDFTPGDLKPADYGMDPTKPGFWRTPIAKDKDGKKIKMEGVTNERDCALEGGRWDEGARVCYSVAYAGPPGFSGLPTAVASSETYPGEEIKDVYTDRDGTKCKASDPKDEFGRCPSNEFFGKPEKYSKRRTT